ncbi:AraC family transcriptional regulator [Dactylosporangium sucinum]|uniref:AraC family transcriptional regulator n=1 Tax=Dactylosporangium sucinum TaxID=1424081 RepID=A0A917T1F7_9ACTN|nr:AraC family transcriptional regulator [Dactylosporangium sucinum]GGM07106.1 AraC family transcriptional regulator [Dactylosporangium sucinum]
MDALTALLDGPRARGAFLLRSVLTPPWSLRVRDEAALALAAVVRGAAWYVPDDGEPVELRPGDVLVVRGPGHYTVADPPDCPPQVVIHPGQRCTTPDGRDLAELMHLGVRTWGDDPGGPTLVLTGAYQLAGEVSRRLLGTLPRALVVPREDWDTPLVTLLADEIAKDRPGQEAVLDRLLDLMLITALRTWLARPGTAPGWYRAQSDPVIGPALLLLHHEPAAPWTVASLAARVGVSRALLARRFAELVGEPPMAYLAGWRLALAADLLLEPGATLGAVARQVGYGGAFALSAAFKRVRGVSPRQHRGESVA